MKTFLFFFLIAIVSTGCTHTIRIKGGRFVTPITAQHQWGGSASGSVGADTRVTLTKDLDSNPPTRDNVRINEDVDVSDLFGLNFVGFEAALSPFESGEIYLDNSLFGLRWQFLNWGEEDEPWVAAIQGGYSSSGSDQTFDDNSHDYHTKTTMSRWQAGVSVGYKANRHIMPYLSYLQERYDVRSEVTNSHGTFGPYNDKGRHQFIALGIMRPSRGFLWGVEYNAIIVDWDRQYRDHTQGALAVRIGGAW